MMMKLLQLCVSRTCFNGSTNSRVLSSFTYSLNHNTSMSSLAAKNTLYSRLMPHGNPTDSMNPILDQWVSEGNPIEKNEFIQIIKLLRKYRRYGHALQVLDWIRKEKHFELSAAEYAVRLDIMSKLHGPEQAENYFDNDIPLSFKGLAVYGSLLNCYAHAKLVDKAETLMQKMRELGYLENSLPYNVMMTLYSSLGKHENLDLLLKEMEEKGIRFSKFTFTIRLNAYALAADISGMETFFKKIETDHPTVIDCHTYLVTANGYSRAGNVEKTKEMLRKVEQLAKGGQILKKKKAYEIVLSMYASIGDKTGLSRVWNLFKQSGQIQNMSYLTMISSLLKLDDIVGAEEIYREWENTKTFFDPRVLNTLINGYCKKGMMGKAKELLDRLIQNNEEINVSTWDHMATGYYQAGQMEEAVEATKKILQVSRSSWKPNVSTLAACVDYLKGKEGAKEFEELLRNKDHIPSELCDRLSSGSIDGI
ncbi:pentatricopeptide repeat-containing protein At2g20710, mitochondrial-like [Impatiens glandulifera]|uniref:pentatricopeptide repeat-containing protein At2g20710, mitochondrial-like n=1 Tax=Impatiens glandulifera TaxID=253017 RepID=UPI001FB0CF39|nr:pentatricopeptide repeat-containing protein At2g20710, mitochondrial-like [Impatiens glandulifera]